MKPVVIVLTFLMSIDALIIQGDKKIRSSELLRLLLNMSDYDKEESPPNGTTVVELGVYVNSFHSVSEISMDFAINIYLREKWNDPRLAFGRMVETNITEFKVDFESQSLVWMPDVFFRNEKRADFHDVTKPNRLLRLSSNGDLWFVLKLSVILSCPMHLKYFPLDVQKCPMFLESFSNTVDEVVFKWWEKPLEMEKEFELPQYAFSGYELRDCMQYYTTGGYPCMRINFILRRNIGFYLIQVYVPVGLIVVLSWVGFWINPESVPARVTVGLLTVLTVTTQKGSSGQSLPRVSYVKAIDIWNSMCLIFVFASLLEFACVNVFSRAEKKRRKKQLMSQAGTPQRKTTGCANSRSPSVRRRNNKGARDTGVTVLGRLQPSNNTAARLSAVTRSQHLPTVPPMNGSWRSLIENRRFSEMDQTREDGEESELESLNAPVPFEFSNPGITITQLTAQNECPQSPLLDPVYCSCNTPHPYIPAFPASSLVPEAPYGHTPNVPKSPRLQRHRRPQKEEVRPELGPAYLDYIPNQLRAVHIDRVSRWLFPITFGIFNIIYWVIYAQDHTPQVYNKVDIAHDFS